VRARFIYFDDGETRRYYRLDNKGRLTKDYEDAWPAENEADNALGQNKEPPKSERPSKYGRIRLPAWPNYAATGTWYMDLPALKSPAVIQ
jgi:hypothetical protein